MYDISTSDIMEGGTLKLADERYFTQRSSKMADESFNNDEILRFNVYCKNDKRNRAMYSKNFFLYFIISQIQEMGSHTIWYSLNMLVQYHCDNYPPNTNLGNPRL